MWIEDLTKALWILNGRDDRYINLVDKITNNIIMMSDHTYYMVQDLVKEYNEIYGE